MTVVVGVMMEKHNVQQDPVSTVSNLDWRITRNFPEEVIFTEECVNTSCLGRKSISVRGDSTCKGPRQGQIGPWMDLKEHLCGWSTVSEGENLEKWLWREKLGRTVQGCKGHAKDPGFIKKAMGSHQTALSHEWRSWHSPSVQSLSCIF